MREYQYKLKFPRKETKKQKQEKCREVSCGICGRVHPRHHQCSYPWRQAHLFLGGSYVRNTCRCTRLPFRGVGRKEIVVRPKKHCPCCGIWTVMTRHHIHPVRHYGRRNNNHILLLCRSCHDDIEKYIPQAKMPHAFYQALLDIYIEKLCKKAKLKYPSRNWRVFLSIVKYRHKSWPRSSVGNRPFVGRESQLLPTEEMLYAKVAPLLSVKPVRVTEFTQIQPTSSGWSNTTVDNCP